MSPRDGAGEMVQRLKATASPSEAKIWISESMSAGSRPPVTPAPRDLAPPAGLHSRQRSDLCACADTHLRHHWWRTALGAPLPQHFTTCSTGGFSCGQRSSQTGRKSCRRQQPVCSRNIVQGTKAGNRDPQPHSRLKGRFN